MAKAKRRSEQQRSELQVDEGMSQAEAKLGEFVTAVAELPEAPAETKPADRETMPDQNGTHQAIPRCGEVRIEMPWASGRDGEHQSDHLEMRLQGRQIEALHRLWKGCESHNRFLPDGRRVVTRVDVIKLMLEHTADALGLD